MDMDSTYANDNKRHARDLDNELDKFSFIHNQQIFDDSPGKSELNQFGDFSGSHSHFDPTMSIERGMGQPQKDEDFSFRSKSAVPPMSTLSSLSSHTDTPRKTRSDGGQRSNGANRFSPIAARKVTALGLHESESEYSPSKYYQPNRTPHGASRLHQSVRKVSPRAFKDTATLFKDLGLEDSVAQENTASAMAGQSFRLPRDIPDLTALLASSRKTRHKVIDSVPVSEDNQKLFEALQELQATIDALEQRHVDGSKEVADLKNALKRTEESVKSEQQRADYAEKELKHHLSSNAKSGANDGQVKTLESRNATLLNALNTAQKDLEHRTTELELAREEVNNVDEERNRVITRLANALEKIDALTAENEALTKRINSLLAQRTNPDAAPDKNALGPDEIDQRITEKVRRQRSMTPPIVQSKRKPSTEKQIENESFSDEGIELSRSILNDSEIEELTREVQERRADRAKKDNNKRQAAKPSTKLQSVPQQQSRTSRSRQDGLAEPKYSKPKRTTVTKAAPNKARRHRLVLQLSEDDSLASDEAGDVQSSDEDGARGVDENLTSDVDEEPVQKHPRRAPVQQHRAKPNFAARVKVENIMNDLSRHNEAKCTICSRKAAAKNRQSAANGQRTTSAGRTASEDANATIRPSQPPLPALESVMIGLEDEFRHLKLKHQALTDEYDQLDPAMSKKKRKALDAERRVTAEAMDGKADQIYAICDVFEAAKSGLPIDNDADFYDIAAAPRPASSGQGAPRQWIHT